MFEWPLRHRRDELAEGHHDLVHLAGDVASRELPGHPRRLLVVDVAPDDRVRWLEGFRSHFEP